MKVWRLAFRVSQQDRRTFWGSNGLFLLFFMFPVANGWLLGSAFAALRDGRTGDVIRYALLFGLSETLRMATIHGAALMWSQTLVQMQTLLRANLLHAQMTSGGVDAGRPVASSGQAITHFRDDVEDVTQLVSDTVDMSAGLVFAVLAAFVLGRIDGPALLVLCLPLLAVGLATRTLDERIKRYRAADRQAGGDVGGLLGDVMSAATTIKVNAATDSVLARVQVLVDRRRHTATRDRVLDESVQALGEGAADVGLGLVLIVSAGAIASGRFGVAELAVFVAYMGWLSFIPPTIGRVLARRKQAAVAISRMSALVPGGDATELVAVRHLPIGRMVERVRPPVARPPRTPLRRVDVVDLRACFGAVTVVDGASFTIERGQFVVLTGPIGSGKTTLLRAVLGLAHDAEVDGSVCWNGTAVADRAAFFTPPNAAFLPQVPQLISDSVRDNIALGPADDDQVLAALGLAEVTADLAQMHDGLSTMIGPRGLRLSGGQRQRVATARALIHRPELVVLDDLSSALDVETELRLWTNLAEAGMTVLAVSHRDVAFHRADAVLHLNRGRLRHE